LLPNPVLNLIAADGSGDRCCLVGTTSTRIGSHSRTTGPRPPYIPRDINEPSTSLKITDERERQFEKESEIVVSGPADHPPMSAVFDAALIPLIQSEENIRKARDELGPATIQRFNSDVLGLRYRTRIESRWR
jgi:hypothetical protein